MLKKHKGPKVRVNERILYNTSEVRVIGADGSQLGILNTHEAIAKAREVGLDLVEVSGAARPPVCRILDYGKYKYTEAKKAKAAKAKQHVVKVKEIKFHPKTDVNDYRYRMEQGKVFLSKGFKLKASVVFRGREMAHVEYGSRWLKQMEEDLEGVGELESPMKQEGRNLSAMFVPAKGIAKAAVKKEADSGDDSDLDNDDDLNEE